jgi:hypothetical protein
MKRSVKFAVLAVALALGLVLMDRMFVVTGEGEAAIQPGVAALRRTDSNKAQATQAGLPQTDASYRSRSAAQRPNQQGVQADHAHNVQAEGQAREQAEAQAEAQAKAEAQAQAMDAAHASRAVDFSVIGIPFPVSESIVAACDPAPGKYRNSACEPDKKLLAEMAEEPREEPWATSAERAIRALVELEPGTEMPRAVTTYTIRALECRTSICFVETASIMGGFHTQFYYFEKTSGLRAEYAVDSVETDELGTKVHVTLYPFTRR